MLLNNDIRDREVKLVTSLFKQGILIYGFVLKESRSDH